MIGPPLEDSIFMEVNDRTWRQCLLHESKRQAWHGSLQLDKVDGLSTSLTAFF